MVKNLAGFLVHLLTERKRGWRQSYISPVRDSCLVCEQQIADAPLYQKYRVCPYCRFHYSITARERIELLADEGSFKETNRSIVSLDPLSFSSRAPYRHGLSRDQKRTGLTEAAVTGQCTIGGNKVVIVLLDAGFMGGSMGSVVGEKVALAFELAASKELPIVAVVTGGGVRLQEGVLSLMQMAKTITAAKRLEKKRMPFIAVLGNPATGQAYASFANMADLILAEPGSLLGLVPIRTLREATKKPLPLDAHTAEAHLRHGLLDMVVDREELKDHLTAVLNVLNPNSEGARPKRKAKKTRLESRAKPAAWEAVQLARHAERPTAMDYIRRILTGFIELHGDRVSRDDRTIVGGPGFLGKMKVVVIGQQRERGEEKRGRGHIYPEGFRKAQRLMRLAAKFKLPLITLIDTPGAHASLEAEEQGIGNAIASTLSLMAELPTPIVSVIVGEGGSEAALAMGMADRILMLENAIYTPISPERAAERLYRDASKAKELAEALKLTAQDCKELGLIDAIVPEPEGGAHADHDEAARLLKTALLHELPELVKMSPRKLVKNRYKKFRRMGEYSTYFKEAVKREVALLQHIVLRGVKGLKKKEAKEAVGEAATPQTPT